MNPLLVLATSGELIDEKQLFFLAITLTVVGLIIILWLLSLGGASDNQYLKRIMCTRCNAEFDYVYTHLCERDAELSILPLCPQCHGLYNEAKRRIEEGVEAEKYITCGTCEGKGRIRGYKCGNCSGEGRTESSPYNYLKIQQRLDEEGWPREIKIY